MPSSINRHIANLAPAIDSASPGDFLGIHDNGGGNFHHQIEAIFEVTNNGLSAYTFTGSGFSSGVDNPTLYLQRGVKYRFNLNQSGHPFQIRVSDGGSAYSTGVVNNGQNGPGTVTFIPDMNAPNSLVYQCTSHAGMVGDIIILDNTSFLDSAATTSLIDSTYVAARAGGAGGGGGLDSAGVTGIVDSAYVAARSSGGGGGGSGFATVNVASQNLTSNITIAGNQNGLSVGPVIIDSGVTITVNDGARYVVV